jgi:putative spermidine/putrescine transport system ATP-binding protein
LENLKVSKIRKNLGEFILEADFEIAAGERAALIGRSGSGKTTLLRLIAGLEGLDPQGGQIFLGSRDISQTPIESRNVGMIFQDSALFPSLSVLGNVIFGLKTHGVSREEAETLGLQWLEKVDLKSKAQSSVSKLSGGEAQRVAFVRALIWKPQLLLLDEPFSALDSELREVLRSELLELHRLWPVPLLLVSHDSQDFDRIAQVKLELREKPGQNQNGSVRSVLR